MADELTANLDSPLPSLLKALLSEDRKERAEALRALLSELRDDVLAAEAQVALLTFATTAPIPQPENSWSDPAHDLAFTLVTAPSEELVEVARDGYPAASDRLKCALLSIMAATKTRAGAAAFAQCVLEHGWPEQPYPRIFGELSKNAEHAELLFPALLERAGELLVQVGNVALAWLDNGALHPERLSEAGPNLVARLDELLERAESQQADGIAWRFSEEYWPTRSEAGFLLDLVGRLDVDADDSFLRATQLTDPWLALFGVLSLVRRERSLDASAIERVAASHETRVHLWNGLEKAGKLALYPHEWSGLDHFAAADMVEWLKFPTELGREPDELVLEERLVFDGGPEECVVYVWRFRGFDGEWLAGVSGAYWPGSIGPARGADTFSRFEAWDSASPAEHAAAVFKTLGDWAES